MDYDVIVVGVRTAGAPLAMNLARKGYRVLALEQGTFNGERRPAEAMTGHAVHRMHKWGLLETLLATGVTPVWQMTISTSDTSVELPLAGELPSLNPRRDVLDRVLAEGAREAGVDVREQTTVTGLLRDMTGAVNGVTATGPDGEFEARARLVVGADGADSFVAREAGADTYDELPAMTAGIRTLWTGVVHEGVEAYFLENRAITIFPTNDGQVSMNVTVPAEEWDQVKDREEETIQATLAQVPGLALRTRCGRRVTECSGALRAPSYYRAPYGPGWALAGDAAFHKDPILGQGINDAFRDADLLADAIDAGFSGRETLETAMEAYRQHRDHLTQKLYRTTYEFSKLQVTSAMLRQLASYAAQMGTVAV